MNKIQYEKAVEELLTAKGTDCQQFFESNNCILELAYFKLFYKEPEKAVKLFNSIKDSDIRAYWGAFFTSLCIGKVKGYATYIELRNFFEIDFNILFSYFLGQYIEEVCKYSDWLAVSNPEVYKYIGRVFLKNNYEDFGLFYLNRGKEHLYNDPELHYLLAEYYSSINQMDFGLKYCKTCLEILPNYYPAETLMNKILLSL